MRLGLLVVVVATSAFAEPVEQGLSWLRSQQSPDGVLGAARGEDALVATTEAVATWQALGLDTQPETLAALSALGTWPEQPDTELRLRRHRVLIGSAWDFSVTTFAAHAEGFEAEEPWLQAWSLLTGQTDAAWIARAVPLVATLDAQGCFARAENGASAEVTSMVLQAVRRRTDVPALLTARAALVSCLLGLQRGGGDFGGAAVTASALLALQSVPGVPASSLSAARNALLSMQAPDGSWGSVRATALAVRALGAASPDWEARVEFGRALVFVSAGTVLQGQPVNARAQFRNASAFASPPLLVRFRLLQGASAVVTRDEWLPALAPGQLVEVSASLPTAGLAGQYVIEAEANAQRLVAELDVTNNKATGAVSVLMATDLALTSESIKFQSDSPTTAKLLITVQNRGSALSTPATVSAWLAVPRTGRPLGSFQVPAGTGQGQSFTGQLIFSTTDLQGPTVIHALVDPEGLITEYDESNNATARYFENGAQNPTDLVATGSVITTPSPPIAGSPFTLRAVVENRSQFSVHGVVVSFIHDGSRVELARSVIPTIAPFNGAFVEAPLLINEPGTTLTFTVDPDGLVNDQNRANNLIHVNPGVQPRAANLVMVAVQTLNGRVVARARADGVTTDATVRLREVSAGNVVRQLQVQLNSGSEQLIAFDGLDFNDPSLVYEACVDPDGLVTEAVETDNCASGSNSSQRAALSLPVENIRFAPYGADVGEKVTISARVDNPGTRATSFAIEFTQGPPGWGGSVLIGRTGRLTAQPGGSAEASLDWVRTEGPVEIYARAVAVDGQLDPSPDSFSGRHLFLEEIFSLGFPPLVQAGVLTVRTGRVTGQTAPDLAVLYSVGAEFGVALVSPRGAAGRSVLWRRPLGTRVYDLTLVDVDRDGLAELVVSHRGFDGMPWMTVLNADGSVRWAHSLALTAACDSNFAPPVAIGDLDSDGVADAAYYAGNNVIVLNGATGDTLVSGQVFIGPIPCSTDWSKLVIADTNGDGRNEVVGAAGAAFFLMERDGPLRWYQVVSFQNLNSVFALADLDADGEPELVLPRYKSNTIALSTLTGAAKYIGPNTDNWPENLAIAPVRQNGLPYTLVANNAFQEQVSALAPPALNVTWSRVFPTVNSELFTEMVMADLQGRGRPQVIAMSRTGGLALIDSRDGRQLMGRPLELWPSAVTGYRGPIVAADVAGDGSSKLAMGFFREQGAVRPFYWPTGPISGDILLYGSSHWRQLPTAWPTRYLTKGQIGEDLKLSNDYRWWTTHNTFNTQFSTTPSTLVADVEVSLSTLSPAIATRVLSVPGSVTNVGGLSASDVEVSLYDGKPSEGGRKVGSSRIGGPLAPRTGAAPFSFSWVAYPEGLHTLCVTVNDDHAVEEPDFENNMDCKVVRVGVETNGCDLAVLPGLVVTPASAQPGDAVTLTASIQNVGSAACTATETSLDDGPPVNRVRVATALVPQLAPGASATVTFDFRAVMGARQWLVTADPGSTTLDIDRSNNVATLDALYSNATQPDLVVESTSAQPQPAYPGERIIAAIRIRNLGSPSPESAVSVGSAQAVVPALASGAAVDVSVTLTAAAMSSVLQVTVDPSALVQELDESNNTGTLALQVTPSAMQLDVVASPNPVGPQTPVAITLQLSSRGGRAHTVTLQTSLVDGSGQVIATISTQPRVVSQLGETVVLPWNSGSTAPGQYFVKVDALESGRLIGSGAGALQILAGSPALAAALTPNRGTVPAGGDVVLSFIARNDSGNLALSSLVGTLSVFNESGLLVFQEVRQLGTLLPTGFRTGASVVSIGRGASPGRYVATLEVADATTLLAQAGAAFDVTANAGTLLGTLSAAAHFQVGAPLPVEVLLENTGALAVTGETLTVELLDAERSLAAQSLGARVVTLAAGASSTQAFSLVTTGVPTGQKLLVARLGGRVLDTRPVTAVPLTDVEPPHIDVTGISDGDFTNQDVRPVVTVTDASAFTSVVTLDGAPFIAGSAITAEGPHVLTVDAQDALANRALLVVRFVIDKTPPVLTLTGPLDGSLHVAAQSLSWSATDASAVTTIGTLNGATISSGAQVAVEGDFVWAVSAEDAAGNVTSEVRRFAIDASAPTVVLTAPSEAYVRGPVILEWTVSDPHPGVVTALLDGSPVTSPATVVAQGPHFLLVTATDAVGNTASSSRNFTIDDTPPTLSITGVTSGAVTRGPVVPLVSASDDSPVTLHLTLDGAPFVSGTSVTVQGPHTLFARAVDAAGNETVRTVSFTIDDVPPVITVTGVFDGALRNTPVTISFTASDPNLTAVFATLDGQPFASGQTVSVEGAHVLVVTAVDAAGNSAVRTVSFTLDFTPPIISVSGVTDGASGTSFTPVVTVSSATLVTITLDGSAFTSGTTVTATGAHVLVVVARDGAGNSATTTVRFTIVPGTGACIDLSLLARREYSPSRWTDAAHRFSRPVRVTIPWTLDVTAGNAGKQKAYLFFDLSGRTTRCEYEGGSPVAHPRRPNDVTAGLTYRFRRCTGGSSAGAAVMADELRLHVHDGDSQRGTTAVTWRLQELAPCAGATSTQVSASGHCGHDSAVCSEELGGDDDGGPDGGW